MIELHLIGYTEDAEHLVLDIEVDGDGRYTVRIDPDLLATVAELREVRVARGVPVEAEARHVVPVPPATPTGPPKVGAPDPVEADEPPPPERDEHRPAALAVPHAQLSPAEIQAQLRAGRSVRSVAADAGTDRAWIERWLPPILAERERVLAEARRRRLDVPRSRPLGPSVDRALTDRGVPADRRTWSATRRADGRWRVSVRFEDRGRPRTATWLMDPDGERVQAASPLAEDLAGPGGGSARRR